MTRNQNTPDLNQDASCETDSGAADVFKIGKHEFQSRLIMGTGRYNSFEQMQATHLAGGNDSSGRNILDFIDLQRYVLLPNTAGTYDAKTAIRCAQMGREILRNLENPGADWVKLEVLGDSRSLLPDPFELLIATEKLVADGFDVLCYTNDDPITARRLKDAGATAVMPAASPIGSGLGLANKNNLRLILDDLKRAIRSS